MKTLGRNADNDLYLEGGKLAVLHDIDAQAQIIEAALLTQQGELQFDEDGGIDYFGTVLLKPNLVNFWAGLVRSRIETFSFVKKVEDFQYKFDKAKNILYWSMTVLNTDGEKIILKDRSTSIDGKPGIDIKWDNIYDKPQGAVEALDMVEGMQYEAENLGRSLDPSTSTLRDTKNVLNRVLFGPSDEEYQKTWTVAFSFSGVPVGAVINFSNLLIDIANNAAPDEDAHYSPFIVNISDGTHFRINSTAEGKDNEIWFADSTGHETQEHTIKKGGTVTISIRGNIAAIKTKTASEPKHVPLPIFLEAGGKSAFAYLTGIAVGENVPLAHIGSESFYGMANLNRIEWTNGQATDITFGKAAFAKCSSLSDLQWIPKQTSSVGARCFMDCSNLKSLLGFENVANLVEPTNEEESPAFVVPEECFKGCTQLKSVSDIYPQTTGIGSRAFDGCISITSIDGFPNTITSFGNYAFNGCKTIAKILYPPSSLQSIGENCFSDCKNLVSVYIPSSLTNIGDYAFAGCSSLDDILSDSAVVPTIGANTFDKRIEGKEVHAFVPSTLLSGYTSTTSTWTRCKIDKYGTYKFSLSNIEQGDVLLGTTSYLKSDSLWVIDYGDADAPQRFVKDVTMLPQYTYAQNHAAGTDVTIKGYVRRISSVSMMNYPFLATEAGSAFKKLTAVTIEDSPLEMIGDYCFAQCTGLASIEVTYHDDRGFIKDGFEKPYCLGERTFWGCSALKSTAWLTEGLGALKDEDENPYPAFGEGCFYQSGIKSLEYASDGVTSLPAYCFAGTQIKSLDGIGGNDLTELGDHCFYGCTQLTYKPDAPELANTGITALANTGVKYLPDYCFANCTSLTSIDGILNVKSSIETDSDIGEETDNRFGTHVFEGCTALNDISALADASEITDLPDYTFSGCTKLTAIAGFKYIKSLGEYCFSGCTSLTDISGLMDAVTSAEEEEPLLTTIPRYCFTGCTGLKTLIGCWDIDTIEEGAFSNCTGLMSITGLGKRIVTIGNLAFQNCTGLLYVGTVAATVPTLSATAFNGVQVAGLTLYVQESLEASYAKATGWSAFGKVTSRTIKVTIDNASELSDKDQSFVKVVCNIGYGENVVKGMWFVDFGDGNGFRHYYGCETEVIPAPQKIKYENRNSRTITFFGDIAEIWSGDYSYDPTGSSDTSDSTAGFMPLLGKCSQNATAVTINSSYLQKIGDYCFCDYGESAEGGNTNPLAVSITMAWNGAIGAFAFAKGDEMPDRGPIGEITSCNAVSIGPYAFMQSGLTSVTAFTSLTEAGEYAFAYNPKITSLEGLSRLQTISKGVFEGCTGLTDTNGISSATALGPYAFNGCTGLTAVKGLSANLSQIGEYAFKDCDGITRVFVSNPTPPYLDENGFSVDAYQNAIVYIPAGAEAAYTAEELPNPEEGGFPLANHWRKFLEGRPDAIRTRAITFVLAGVSKGDKIAAGMGIVSASGPWTISYGDNESMRSFNAGETVLPSYTFQSGSDKVVKLSGPITAIRCTENAFPLLAKWKGWNGWLKSVEGSDALEITSIGEYTFAGCSALESITDMPTVTAVGAHAFDNCASLANVSGLTAVASIGDYAFAGCAALTGLYGLHSVKTIGSRAFNGCTSLARIDGLGMNVTEIGTYAFASCPLAEVQMFASPPPSISTTTFDGLDLAKVPLYVRTKDIESYTAAVGWSLFENIRSRYVEFTLTGCPANVKVDGSSGKVVADTFWAVDWDVSDTDGFPRTATQEDGDFLPEHTYALAGNHVFRIEGDVRGIAAAQAVEVTTAESGEPTDIAGNSFVTLSVADSLVNRQGATYVSKHLTAVASSEHSQIATVGEGTFLKNTSLASASFRTLTAIGKAAFAYDTSLTSTEMLLKVKEIGDYAFYGCTGLADITSLNAVTGIGTYAFGGLGGNWRSMQCGVSADADGFIPINFPQIPNPNPFGVVDVEHPKYGVNLYVPTDSIAAYQKQPPWMYFSVASQTITFTMRDIPSGTVIAGLSGNNSVGNAKVTVDGAWTIDWGDGSDREIMPETQTSFNEHTYSYDANATYPQEVVWYSKTVDGETTWYLQEARVTIGGAFKALGTQSPTLRPFLSVGSSISNPYLVSVSASTTLASLKTIGACTFQGCTGLEQVRGFTNVETIGDSAFQGCTALADLGDESTCFLAAKTIGNSAFAGCTSLVNLAAFPHVLNIGIRAFSECSGLISTSGLGADYANVPYYTVYNPDLRFEVGDRFPRTWATGRKTVYTLEDIIAKNPNLEVLTGGWKVFRQLEIDSSYLVTNVEWENDPALNPTFGSYAFEGCMFSTINMDAFEAPPTIQTTTFTVNPNAVVVYVPPATEFVDPVEMYRTAPGWKAFFNIVASSSMTFTIEAGALHGPDRQDGANPDSSGTGICGFGNVLFTGENITIDWGDGTEEQKVKGGRQDAVYTAKFPDHAYADGFSPEGPVTIKLRGNITGITGFTEEDEHKPLFAVCHWIRTYATSQAGEEYLDTIEPTQIDYTKLTGGTAGSNAPISTIGDYAFYGCTGMKEFKFKKASSASAVKLSSIGTSAFEGCTALERIENNNGMAAAADGTPASIGARAFYHCESLQDVKFLTGAVSIGESSFEGCSDQHFTSLVTTVGEGETAKTYGLVSATSIGVGAFKGCTSLVDITLPDTLISLNASAFEGCTGVTGITWEQSDSVNVNGTIGDRAFYGCSNGNADYIVTIPSQVHYIGKSAFYDCGMTEFTWSGTAGTGDYATYSLDTDQLADGEPGVFEGSKRLQRARITLPVSELPYRVFCNCAKLVYVEAGNIAKINPYAFYGCESLSGDSFNSIVAGVGGTIGNYAFARCFALTKITIPKAVTSLGEGCFSRSENDFMVGNWDGNGVEETIPKFKSIAKFEEWMTSKYGKQRMDVWDVYDLIMQTSATAQENGLVVSWGAENETTHEWEFPATAAVGAACFMNCQELQINWARFPQVAQLPAYCFYNCARLFEGTNLSELPSSISYLGRFALARTAMVSLGRVKRDEGGVVLDGEEVPVFAPPISASLAPALFFGCTKLESLGEDIVVADDGDSTASDESTAQDATPSYPDGLVRLFSTIPSAFPDACFYGCEGLKNVNSLAIDLQTVTRLGNYCFANCVKLSAGNQDGNITEAMEKVTQIGDGCFYGCIGLTGTFYGMPNVSYYPYMSFYGCKFSQIECLHLPPQSESDTVIVTLEGESFGGNPDIESIGLPYPAQVVGIVAANKSSDPFSGVENKGTVTITVPSSLVAAYENNAYWQPFSKATSFDGLTHAMTITMAVPTGGDDDNRTIRGFGSVQVDVSQADYVAIEWGDGTGFMSIVPSTGMLNLSTVSHTYRARQSNELTRSVTMKLYGAVTSFEGAADNVTSSIVANKTVVPFLYTAVRDYVKDPDNEDTDVPRIAENTWFNAISFSTAALATIGDGSFGYCTNLQFTSIPNTVTTLGNNAFFGCDQIESLDFLPASVKKIGQYCFAYCANLTDYQNFKTLSNLQAVPAGCFAKEKSNPPGEPTRLDWLPSKVKSIGFAAFQHVCFSHFAVDTTNSITVNNYAFRYNTSLIDFTRGNIDDDPNPTAPGIKLKLTGKHAFRECTELTSLNGLLLDPSVTAVPEGAFRGCEKLGDITALSQYDGTTSGTAVITAVKDGAFYNTRISSLAGLPSTVTAIGDSNVEWDADFDANRGGAFAKCTLLTSLAGMPSGISYIGHEAFKGCTLLANLDGIEATSVQRLGWRCFYGCSSLAEVGARLGAKGLPGTLAGLGGECFAGCPNITFILLTRPLASGATLPITELGDTINQAQTVVEHAVFDYGSLKAQDGGDYRTKVYVPASALNSYKDEWGKATGSTYLRFNPAQIVSAASLS